MTAMTAMTAFTLAWPLVVDLAAAAAFFPALSLGRRARVAALACTGLAIAASPVLVPVRHPVARFFLSLVAVSLLVKLYDLHVGATVAPKGRRPGWVPYWAFLVNWFWLVWRKPPAAPASDQGEGSHLVRRALTCLAAGGVAWAVFRVDWRARPFAAEHVAQVLVVYWALGRGLGAGAGAARLLGVPVVEPMDHPIAAHSPPDFWRRWNRPAQQFLYEDVFKQIEPVAGPRS